VKRAVATFLVVLLVVATGAATFALFMDDDGEARDPTAGTVTTTTFARFEGEGARAFCEADARLNQELVQQLPETPTPAEVEEYYGKSVAAVRQLEQLAPDEIRADVAITVAAYERVRDVLSAAGWDPSKVPPGQDAAIQTPEVVRAGQRLKQYDERVCGLVARPSRGEPRS
jgi:hypothetical protein